MLVRDEIAASVQYRVETEKWSSLIGGGLMLSLDRGKQHTAGS